MLLYIILGVTLLYTVVAYYLCLTAEMPELIEWREEGCECRHLLICEAEGSE